MLPASVVEAFCFKDATVTPVDIGLINQTYFVDQVNQQRCVVQKLNPIFAATVNDDIDSITSYLAQNGMITPRLIRTRDGHSYVEANGIWRALTYIEGRTLTEVSNSNIAYSAGELISQIHQILSHFEYDFSFARPSIHDFNLHFKKLSDLTFEYQSEKNHEHSCQLAEKILSQTKSLPNLPTTKKRMIHGDLKITNIRFSLYSDQAIALLDLDTMGYGTLPIELGDALRSWCNPLGESNPDAVIDVDLFETALKGYQTDFLDIDERDAIVAGLEVISLELAARFCIDAFEDRYFGWDPRQFSSRVEHNLIRAQSQLSLTQSIVRNRKKLNQLVKST